MEKVSEELQATCPGRLDAELKTMANGPIC
jgi:hypothetical protein